MLPWLYFRRVLFRSGLDLRARDVMVAMRRPEIETAAGRMSGLVGAVDDADLERVTPCADYRVAALLDHIDGLVAAFVAAGTKTQDPSEDPPGPGDANDLRPDWRTALPADLDALVAAWRSDDAYEGTITAGSLSMPADAVAVVASEGRVVHGWDLARALDRPYDATAGELSVIDDFF